MSAIRRDQACREVSEKGRLPSTVKIAINLEVMMTVNVKTKADIASGSRGLIEKIKFDPGEKFDQTSKEVMLKHVPLRVLVKLYRMKAKQMPGLAEGLVPVTPME
ncbi:hypothetical protein FRC07_001464 [Ceratobasidium sp. 392]|nr:hypothetical protein FRC07_001464 [Ceratobasidium sp. 392]